MAQIVIPWWYIWRSNMQNVIKTKLEQQFHKERKNKTLVREPLVPDEWRMRNSVNTCDLMPKKQFLNATCHSYQVILNPSYLSTGINCINTTYQLQTNFPKHLLLLPGNREHKKIKDFNICKTNQWAIQAILTPVCYTNR